MTDVRHWVRGRLAGVVADDLLEDIVLVVVELVANAEQHTHSPERLAISPQPSAIQIEVTDGDPALPVLLPASPVRLGGRGVYLVDALATQWGVRQCPPGKCVWALFKPPVPPDFAPPEPADKTHDEQR